MVNNLIKTSMTFRKDQFEIIEKARKIENRSRSNFAITSMLERAKKILGGKKDATARVENISRKKS